MNDKQKPPAQTGGQEVGVLPLCEYRDTISIYARGVKTKGYTPRSLQGKPDGSGGERGEITGWSKNSRRRLRNWLLVNQPVGGVVIAVTLTVPGEPIQPDDWRKLMQVFANRLIRAKVGLVWRLELQKRGMPHLHCLAVPAPLPLPRLRRRRARGVEDVHLPSINVGAWLRWTWLELIDTLPPSSGRVYIDGLGVIDVDAAPRSHLVGAREHAVDLSADEGDRWYRYLCDHTTKSKQEQIATWQGFRHWGVIYRPAFVEVAPSDDVRLHRRQFAAIYRQLRKLSRRRIHDSRCPFGSRRASSPRRSCGGSAVWFGVSPSLILKLVDWASDIPPETQKPSPMKPEVSESPPLPEQRAGMVCGVRTAELKYVCKVKNPAPW